ncbi:hypothetical protein A2U01_0091787, partial [Trifolium medium]|nr:hypothetical protein [Trifolium medium]
KESHTSLIAMMERCLGKSMVADEGSASVVIKTAPEIQGSPEKNNRVGSSGLRSDTLTEF